MTACVALAYVFGPFIVTLIVNSTGTETSRWAYRAVFCAQYGVALISTIAWPFMPESAYWLMSKNRRSDALKSLHRLGMSEIQAERHTDNIQHTLDQISQETAGASFLECFRRSNLRRTIVSIAPLSIQALCGVTFVINYTAYYLQLAGFSAHKSFQIQIAQVVLCMVGNVQSWFLIDRVGRRNLTFYGLLVVTIMLIVTGGLATVGTHACTVGTVALLVLYCWVYNLSIGATAYALVGETSTPRLRAKTVAIGLALQNGLYLMWAFVLPYLFNPDKADLGAKVTFIFGGLSVFSLVYLWVYQPETAHRSFQELDEMFLKRIPARQFKNYKTETEYRS
jgi:SP family general alpha glucoside:H+ symporter-like MFS transporter